MRIAWFPKLVFVVVGLVTYAQAEAAQWQQVWADEFNYTGAPDPTKWGYETGKVRNNEAQYYSKRPDNSSVANGVLTITAKKEDYAGAAYTSASLQTMTNDNKKVFFSTAGGRIETRAKLPAAKGSWPAFWTLGTKKWDTPSTEWPKCGEIDVMESVQRLNNASDPYTNYGSLHFQDPTLTTATQDRNVNKAYVTPRTAGKSLTEDWHTYRIDWYADRVEWYVDDIAYQTVNFKDYSISGTPFADPHYLLISYAVGGTWGGTIDPNFTSDSLQIDYVRVSQLVAIPEPATVLPIAFVGAARLLSRRRHAKKKSVSAGCERTTSPFSLSSSASLNRP